MAWENRNNQKNVSEIAPVFVKYVKELFFNDIGLGGAAAAVCDVKSSVQPTSFEEELEPQGDRFRLLLPVAGRLIKWEVIFSWFRPTHPADFLFPDDFLQKIDMSMVDDKNFLPSLFNWDPDEPTALLKVIRELFAIYKEYQIELLDANCRAGMELRRALALPGMDVDRFEVLTGPGDSIRKARAADKKTITLLIQLPVDFSSLQADGPDESRAMLYVEFATAADLRPLTELRFSPTAERLLDSAMAATPPPPFEGPLGTVVPKATGWLRAVIARQAKSRAKRGDLLAALQRKLHPGLMEMDTRGFYSATFLVEVNDFHVLISFSLADILRPAVQLLSVYHMDASGQPLSKPMEDFPFSALWKPEQQVKYILDYVFQRVPAFQQECVDACP